MAKYNSNQFLNLNNTNRLTNPHIRVNITAVYNSSLAFTLFGTKLFFKTAVILSDRVVRAVLSARLVRIHIHFVFYIAL